jgi:hypothetical protein
MCLANAPGETFRASKAGTRLLSLAGYPPDHRAAAEGYALLSSRGILLIISLPAGQRLARLTMARDACAARHLL